MQLMIPGAGLQPMATFPVTQGLGTNTSLGYGSYITQLNPGVSLIPPDILSSTPVLVSGSPGVPVQCSSSSSSSSTSSPSQKLQRTDKLEVCA
ncbi:muscleblind-like protein 2a [Oryzias melastigma]|uniref:muscleblind-like protein 2a n=1 Tax=Oryzias melastigma TaxID=30732 RepID=UPI00168D7675|nr:muscleblind-like protein 2a [Oryzias melastigma]